jgi:hypothetical protein
MSKRNGALLFLLALTTGAVFAAGPEQTYQAPRTENGQPDLQGVWNFSSDVPLERPSAFADKKFFTREELAQQKIAKEKALATVADALPVEAVGLAWLDYAAKTQNLRTSLISYPDNGRLPKLVEGVRRVPGIEDFVAALNESKEGPPPALLSMFGAGKKDGPEDFGAGDRCLGGAGPPFAAGFDNNYTQVIQAKDHAVLLTEPHHQARIVPLDGRPQLGDRLRSWSGDSRGHWEGETLVIETNNFSNRTRSFAGAGTSHDKVVTERFTRLSRNVLEYEATIIDPKTFQDKIVLSFPMARSDSHIYEVACHEGNYSMFNMLSGARKEEQDLTKTKQ